MTSIQFTKMHGIGNDYIYLDCIANPAYAGIDPNTIRQLSDRHKGIGADGVVLILSSDDADFGMRMFNADGSEGAMCGNAIRCVGKYVADNGYTAADGISVATRSGIKHLQLHRESGKVATVAVDMGYASFSPAAIPMNRTDELIGRPVEYCTGGEVLQVVATALSVGNPHCVIPMADVDRFPLEKWGAAFENHPLFPDRINTEIAELVSPQQIRMRVWERGSAETMACGTGACATVAAFCRLGLVPFDTDITVSLRGGDLTIACSPEYRLTMTGSATEVFRGETTANINQ